MPRIFHGFWLTLNKINTHAHTKNNRVKIQSEDWKRPTRSVDNGDSGSLVNTKIKYNIGDIDNRARTMLVLKLSHCQIDSLRLQKVKAHIYSFTKILNLCPFGHSQDLHRRFWEHRTYKLKQCNATQSFLVGARVFRVGQKLWKMRTLLIKTQMYQSV